MGEGGGGITKTRSLCSTSVGITEEHSMRSHKPSVNSRYVVFVVFLV